KDGTIALWSTVPKSRAPVARQLPPDVKEWAICSGTLLCTHTNGTVSRLDPSTLTLTPQFSWPEEDRTNSIKYQLTASGKCAFADRQGGWVLLDLAARRKVRLEWAAGDDKLVAISPDEKLVAGAAAGTDLRIWPVDFEQPKP